MTIPNLTAWVLCLSFWTPPGPDPEAVGPWVGPPAGPVSVGPVAAGWVASASDNICGLRDPAQLSTPAKVDFELCLAGTPEMKRMKKEGIRPQSPEGIQLRSEAVDRVTRAANTVREAGGHCSVWKAIEHSDGRRIPDLTSRVLGQY